MLLATLKDNMEMTEIDDQSTLIRVAKQLQIDLKQLNKVLTAQTVTVGKETIRRHLSARQMLDQRDSLIKAIYSQLFDFLVEFINETLAVGLSAEECKPNSPNCRSISILDIFGFENLQENNSFKQLCINYSNEILQQFFIRQVFKLEQAEYESQKIGWKHLDYVDNQPIINLFAASHLGMFQLIDEETNMSQVGLFDCISKSMFRARTSVCSRNSTLIMQSSQKTST